VGADPARDEVDGGAGDDYALYFNRQAYIDVDLAQGIGGELDEDDSLTGIENVEGGGAGGRLAGDENANVLIAWWSRTETTLLGRAGNDRLVGSAADEFISGGLGNDRLDGQGGSDVLRGDEGADRISVAFPEAPRGDDWGAPVNCGAGRDTVIDSRWHDLVWPGCERVATRAVAVAPVIRRVDPGTLELTIERLRPRKDLPFCRALVVLFAPYPRSGNTPRRQRIGAVLARVTHGRATRARLKLNDYGRKMVARRPRLSILVRFGAHARCEETTQRVPVRGFTARLGGFE
jgi:hypothetical protein